MIKYKKSILKWAGNKIRLMETLQSYIGNPNIFVEPFGGSLSVSLNTSANEYRVGDINADIINLYNTILEDDNFIQTTKHYFNNGLDRLKFNDLREEFNKTRSPYIFLYLNRHCFNGLTRYNKSGNFNVPFGEYKSVYFPDEEINNFKIKFSNTKIRNTSFNDMSYYDGLCKGDVVYFDPPYLPLNDTSNFTNYSKEGFTKKQHEELAEICNTLAKKGVTVVISNHDVSLARELYKEATIHSIMVNRSISASGMSRNKVPEIIAIWNADNVPQKNIIP